MNLAFHGLLFNLRDKFERQKFADSFQLVAKVSKYEQLPTNRCKRPHEDFIQNVALMQNYESEYESDENENIEINVAKMVLDKPYICQPLKPSKINGKIMARLKTLSFHVSY